MQHFPSVPFPFNDEACVAWFLLPVYYIPLFVIVGFREYFAHCVAKHDDVLQSLRSKSSHNKTDETQSHASDTFTNINSLDVNVEDNEQVNIRTIALNSLNTTNVDTTDDEHRLPTTETFQNENCDVEHVAQESNTQYVKNFEHRTSCVICEHLNTVNIHISSYLSHNIGKIILRYSHEETEIFKMEYEYENAVKYRLLTSILRTMNKIAQAYGFIGNILYILTLFLFGWKFSEWSEQSNNDNDTWNRFLIFNAMLMFHPCFKYCGFLVLWMLVEANLNDEASDDDDCEELETLTKLINFQYYAKQGVFWWLGCLTIVIVFVHYLSAALPVYIVAILVFIWPFVLFSTSYQAVGAASLQVLRKLYEMDHIALALVFAIVHMFTYHVFGNLFFHQLYFSCYCWYQGQEWSECVLFAWKSQYCSNPDHLRLFWQFDDWKSIIVSMSLWF